MKRRIIIFGGATALYMALMAITWIIGTRQAEQKTEAMLDYAVNDMRQTLDGAIDTVLEHLACTTVRHFKKPVAHSLAEMAAVAAEFDIDELCLIDRTGLILATNDPDNQGVNMDEITSNIVKHSHASGFELDVQFLVESSGVKLLFMDDGVPYDPLSHVDPDTTLPAAERPVGGLGILMVKKMTDSITYERVRNRNCLTVFKQVERGLDPAEADKTN